MSWLILTLLIGALIMAGLLLSIQRGIAITGEMQNAQAGVYVSNPLKVTGAQYGADWEVIGNLPPGWEFLLIIFPGMPFATEAMIFGVATTPGQYTYSVKVTDGRGVYALREFTVTITAADTLKVTDGSATGNDGSDLRSEPGAVGEPFYRKLQPIGGVGPYSFTDIGGSNPDFPAGLSFNVLTGEITGTPTSENLDGSDKIWLKLEDSASSVIRFLYAAITVAFEIEDNALPPTGTRGALYGHTFSLKEQSVGTPPIAWSLISGTLPPGLTLSADGYLSGRPEVTTAATGITLQADSAGGASDTAAFTIVIDPAYITVAQNLPDGAIGVAYYGTLIPSGGYGWYTAQVQASGSHHFPDGLSLQKSTRGPNVWEIVGTPANTTPNLANGGVNTFDVIFTDGYGNTATEHCSITLAPTDLQYGDVSIPSTGEAGQFYHGDFSIQGGLKPYGAFSVVAGSLPPGLTVHADDPFNGRFYLGHVPTTAGVYTFTLRAQDGQTVPDTVDHDFKIKIDP